MKDLSTFSFAKEINIIYCQNNTLRNLYSNLSFVTTSLSIICVLSLLLTAKYKTHGKSNKLTAKAKAHGKTKNSRQNQNTRGKSKKLPAKAKSSRQNQRKGSWALIVHAKAVGVKSNMAASSSLSSRMFCSNCGVEALSTANFCTRCGQGNRVKINK